MDPGYLDNTPMRLPPPGKITNFTNPESRSYQLVALIVILSVLVFVLVFLRIYSRLKVTHAFGADDFLWRPGGGILGIHAWDVPLSHYIEFRKGSLADSVLIRIANTTIKLAFLVFYLRLFSPIAYVRWMIWAGIGVLTAICVVFVVFDFVACSPWPGENGDWLAPSLLDRCDLTVHPITASAFFGIIADFYILFIPLHRIPRLSLSRKKKIGMILIFLTGLLATSAGIINLVIRSDIRIFDRSDFTWTVVPVYATNISEICIGLVCHSLPVVSVLFVGPFTTLSKYVNSWVEKWRRPHQSPSDSSSDLPLGDHATPQRWPLPNQNGSPGRESHPSDGECHFNHK
ncbi:hypothetical protein M426DRAFT_18767 [Hypoxylon sp. CI-4A]|nr:hypothetical protein M426DRAFT_18767 [Hypoxylon sp. CI-4A]